MKNKKFAMFATIFALAWPTMLEQLMQTAVQYIDTAMVGSLGTQAMAAAGATSTVNWLVSSTVSSIGVGFLAYISQAFGAGEGEKAKRASAQAVTVTVIIGIIITVITTSLSGVIPVWMQVDPSVCDMASRYFLILYSPMLFRSASIIFGTVLRSAGDTKTPMRAGIAVNIINTVLNFLFIYQPREVVIFGEKIWLWGAGWGIEGAAIASAIAYTIGGTVITVALWKHDKVSPKKCSFLPNGEILKRCMRVAAPNMLQRFATSFGYVVFASMINALGDVSTAAHTVANTVESAFYIPGWGMQTAAATLAGNAYGARDNDKLKSLSKSVMAIEVGLMLISGGLLFAFAEPLVKLFSHDTEVIKLGTTVLKMVAVSEPFYGVPIVIEGIMQGVGKTVAPLVCNITGMWCVRIAGTFVCTRLLGLGLTSAWGCMIAHNMLLFVLFGIYFITGKWNPMREVSKKL